MTETMPERSHALKQGIERAFSLPPLLLPERKRRTSVVWGRRREVPRLGLWGILFTLFAVAALAGKNPSDENGLGLSDEAIPYEEIGAEFLQRPKPLSEIIEDLVFPQNRERNRILLERKQSGVYEDGLELPKRKNLFGGNAFLGKGEIFKGVELPTGAVWQPVFIPYGEFRTAVQSFNNGPTEFTEWANRLNLYGNLYLTPTERILVQVRPLDTSGEFSGYQFGGGDEGSSNALNGRIRTLFFEGDIGELFPFLDPHDKGQWDLGLAIGRQPLNFQEGILLNDSVDSIGVSRSSMFLFGSSAAHLTGYFGMNELHRNDGRSDDDAKIFGMNMGADYFKSTYELDIAYVDGGPSSGGDGVYGGVGQTRRFGHWNSTTRLNLSQALQRETDAVSSGWLFSHQLSRTILSSHDIFYLNSFWGIDDYASAGRDPDVGGPLGLIGILYDAPGLGRFQAPLGNHVGNNLGFATGIQHFFGSRNRTHLIIETGGRLAFEDRDQSSYGLMTRFQKAFGQHYIFAVDAFAAGYDDPLLDDLGYGGRCEWQIKF